METESCLFRRESAELNIFLHLRVTIRDAPVGVTDPKTQQILWQRKAVLSRISALREHPASVKFVSFEPLIGPIPPDFDLTGIDWAFFGGESHRTRSQARPMELQWLRDGIALCESHGCKPYIKQLGTSWAAKTGNWRFKDKAGKDSLPWPEDLRP